MFCPNNEIGKDTFFYLKNKIIFIICLIIENFSFSMHMKINDLFFPVFCQQKFSPFIVLKIINKYEPTKYTY